jgi:hypothetical protein
MSGHEDVRVLLRNNSNDADSGELAEMTIVTSGDTNGLLWFAASDSDTGLNLRSHNVAHRLRSDSSTPHRFIE